MRSVKINQKLLSFVLSCTVVILTSCSGDVWISGKYYLSESDKTAGKVIYYKLDSGDMIGRSPATVLEYGFTDSFVISKNKAVERAEYYVIDRTKDSEYADPDDYLTGPLNQGQFDSFKIARKISVKLRTVK